jgi:hypothetical protein
VFATCASRVVSRPSSAGSTTIAMAITEVLLSSDVEAQVAPTEYSRLLGAVEEPLGDLPQSTRKEQAVAGLAVISFAASITSIIFTSNPVVYISGIIGAALSPYAAVQQRKIS